MGLDLRVKWDGMTDAEYQAQITGYNDAQEVGYMRYSWPGVRYIDYACAKYNLPNPIPLYRQWAGDNGEEFTLTPENCAELERQRVALRDVLATFDFVPLGANGDFLRDKFTGGIALIDFALVHADRPGAMLYFGQFLVSD